MPWDLRGVPVALTQFLRASTSRGNVLVPGCGSGYEVQTFRNFGWTPLAIDFSSAAIERARVVLGPNDSALQLADFFSSVLNGKFELVYERTFLCSLPPDRWSNYGRRMAELIKPGGCLVGVFVYGEESDPPPYPLTATVATSLFESDFELIEDRAISAGESLSIFADKERWQVWRRRCVPLV